MPIEVGHGQRVHFLVSHPTPPVFDGPEDRNGTRNHGDGFPSSDHRLVAVDVEVRRHDR